MANAPLTLTGIGEKMVGRTSVRHQIKRVDRWLAHQGLYDSHALISKFFFAEQLQNRKELEILVDWSGCGKEFAMIRASVTFDGRAIPIYQSIFPLSQQQTPAAHREFLTELKNIVPEEANVLIITDRGFGLSWFKMILEHGWQCVGRLHPSLHVNFCHAEPTDWSSIESHYSRAGTKPVFLGSVQLGKKCGKNRVLGNIVICKQPSNIKDKPRKKRDDVYERYYKQVKPSPWVLFTSLSVEQASAIKIKNIYKKRMQIEQNFRDTKSIRFGMAFRYVKSNNITRVANLLFIGIIAYFLMLLIGKAAEKDNLHLQYQANSIKHRRVLSHYTLAKKLLFHAVSLPINQLLNAFRNMQSSADFCSSSQKLGIP